MNRREQALQILEAATSGGAYTAGDVTAHVHVTLGEHEDAIRELQRACDEHSSSLHLVGIAPEFVPLAFGSKVYRPILEKIGVDPEKAFSRQQPPDYCTIASSPMAVRAHAVA